MQDTLKQGQLWNSSYIVLHVSTSTPLVLIAPINRKTGKPRKTGQFYVNRLTDELIPTGPRS